MRRIMILGAAGAIGKYMVDYFYERKSEYDIELITVDIKEGCEFLHSRSTFYKVDVSKKEEWEKLPKDVCSVIDLATVMPARMIGFDNYKYLETNVIGTHNVLEYCRVNKVERVLFAHTFGDILSHASSDKVLKTSMIPAIDYHDSKSVYITSMITATELIKCYHALYGLRSFLFRLPTIHYWTKITYCEEGLASKEGYRLLIDQATNGEDIYVWGDPTREKDMIYVKDLCQMFYKACFVDREYGYYNVGTGFGITLLDQIKGMIEVFGTDKKSRVLYSPEMRNAPQYIMDIENARAELGYEPCYSYVEMLRDMKKERDLNRFGE